MWVSVWVGGQVSLGECGCVWVWVGGQVSVGECVGGWPGEFG